MTGVRSLVLALAGSSAVAATPALTGVYQVGEVGLVEFSTQGGAVVGRYRAGGECGFEPELKVVNGNFEGNVFVGTVLLCQEGPRCPSRRTFPILAFYRNERLIGSVKFEPGCISKATDDRRLLFSPATLEEKQGLSAGSSVADMAIKKATPDLAGAAVEAIRAGERKLDLGEYGAARRQFDLAIQYDGANYKGWLGLGVAQIKLKEYKGARSSLEQAQALIIQREGKQSIFYAHAQYNLACVYAQEKKKKEAFEALGNAAKFMRTDLLDQLDHDPDLAPIRGEQEFKLLAAELRLQRSKKGK
jgi:hypothetical protein